MQGDTGKKYNVQSPLCPSLSICVHLSSHTLDVKFNICNMQ